MSRSENHRRSVGGKALSDAPMFEAFGIRVLQAAANVSRSAELLGLEFGQRPLLDRTSGATRSRDVSKEFG